MRAVLIFYTLVFSLLGKLPNTYAFTKALGEAIVMDQIDNLPVHIVRPSVSKSFLRNQVDFA